MADAAGPDSAADIRKDPSKLPVPRARMQGRSRLMMVNDF
jgi:hypothetical protein